MPGLINTLNRSYLSHQELNPENIIRQFNDLNRFLVDRKCTFKGEPMPMLLKPNFISRSQTGELVRTVELMSSILDKFVQYYLENKAVRDIMKFPERENSLFFIEPGYSKPLVISRLDAFLNDHSIKFLEFNCDSPAGIAYSDVLEEGFLGVFREYPFLAGWKIDSLQRQELLLASLLECYNQYREDRTDQPEKPVIAIVDWKDVSTYSEFQMHKAHFEANGYETIIASPQEFSVKNGRAIAGGKEVNLVYRRVITRELVERWNETTGFVDCISRGLVCCCNSFRSYIVGNKKVLTLITDPEFQEIYNDEELALIRETIPWTKILADHEVTYEGRGVRLKDFVLSNREMLVMKPANMYGGKDVFLGKETEARKWEVIMNAHISDESWVVQEYVDIPRDTYPEIGESVSFREKFVNINPFALLGRYSGTITRVSDHPVINVSAGGGLVPTFTASKP